MTPIYIFTASYWPYPKQASSASYQHRLILAAEREPQRRALSGFERIDVIGHINRKLAAGLVRGQVMGMFSFKRCMPRKQAWTIIMVGVIHDG
jgi:hypothetical protein